MRWLGYALPIAAIAMVNLWLAFTLHPRGTAMVSFFLWCAISGGLVGWITAKFWEARAR